MHCRWFTIHTSVILSEIILLINIAIAKYFYKCTFFPSVVLNFAKHIFVRFCIKAKGGIVLGVIVQGAIVRRGNHPEGQLSVPWSETSGLYIEIFFLR